MEEDRPPAGGPAYQIVGALVGIAIGVGGAVLACGYGLGSLREPGPGPVAVHRQRRSSPCCRRCCWWSAAALTDSEAFTRSSLLPVIGARHLHRLRSADAADRLRDSGAVLLCVIWLKFLGGESWRNTVVISVVTVAAFYFLFLYGLRIPLPHLISF